MKTKKIKLLLAMIIGFFINFASTNVSADINVNSVATFSSNFNSVTNGETLVLTNNFRNDISTTSNGIVISTASGDTRNITIDGSDLTFLPNSSLSDNLFEFTHNGSGVVTFKNMKIDGNEKIIFVLKGNGKVVFENIKTDHTKGNVFYNEMTGIIDVKNSTFENGTSIVFYDKANISHAINIDNSMFYNNVTNSGDGGLAINIGSNADVKIKNSTFKENGQPVGTGNHGGAIANGWGTGNINLDIEKSYFYKNYMTNNVGGAIGILSLQNGEVNILDSVFEKNESRGGTNVSDAGAIAIKNSNSASFAEVVIAGNTFLENLATDNGGAMLIEGANNSQTVANIFNNTFIQNQALCNASSSCVGGAIQTYGAPNSIISHNTFYQNTISGSGNGGGAIGLSGSSSLGWNTAKVANNIFMDNTAPGGDADKQNVASRAGINVNIDNNGNVGYDNGAVFIPGDPVRNALVTAENTFTEFYQSSDTLPSYAGLGDAKPIVIDFVGASNNTQNRLAYIPSPIIDEMLRTGDPKIVTGIQKDVRGYPREQLSVTNPYHPTAGAVEIYWTKFDPGLGQWSSHFDVVSEGGIKSLVNPDQFYKVNNPPTVQGDGSFVYEENRTFTRNTLVGPAGMGFVEWQNASLATDVKDVNEIYTARKQTYVAQWLSGVFNLDFDLKGGTTLSGHGNDFNTQAIIDGVNNNLATAPNSIPIKSGYEFKGWYESDTYSGSAWNFAVNSVNKDTTLYAKWEVKIKNSVKPVDPGKKKKKEKLPKTGSDMVIVGMLLLSISISAGVIYRRLEYNR